MEASMPAAAAPPYVSYGVAYEVVVPDATWPYVYASLQAYKAHVQEYPGCQRLDAWVSAGEGTVRIHCYTTWDTAAQLEAFLERGYTFERLLDDLDAAPPERTFLMEKVF